MPRTDLTIWTIGHSTRTFDGFIDLLRSQRIELLADVRSYPGSRKFPHFSQQPLAHSLEDAGVEYRHFPELGGRRRALPDSPNSVWRNASFRGYADYMETQPFRDGIERLLAAARSKHTAIMCSEAVWWRCHRSMIADFLKPQGVRVLHILSQTSVQEHPYTSAARIVDGRLSYAPPGLFSQPTSTKDQETEPMAKNFKVGDHVEWNSEAGRVRGTIKEAITSEITFKGYIVHASKGEPQYLIKSDKTDHMAMHKGSALTKLRKKSE
jgi:hypothetical protein